MGQYNRMYSFQKKGIITGRVGPMFSGKSSEIMRLLERREIMLKNKNLLEENPIFSFRPTEDNRYTDKSEIVTHSGKKLDAILFEESKEVREFVDNYKDKPDSVYISEVIFTDSGIIDVIKYFRDSGINVFYEGLNQTSEGFPFPFKDRDQYGNFIDDIGTLMAMTDDLQTLYAICSCCGNDFASKTYYKYGKKEVLKVGGAKDYEARCIDCWEPN